MADQGGQGEDWDAGEFDVIIADYLASGGSSAYYTSHPQA